MGPLQAAINEGEPYFNGHPSDRRHALNSLDIVARNELSTSRSNREHLLQPRASPR